LQTGSEAAALVSGCDKLDNITSLTRAMEIAGNEATLSRFKGGSADLIWYYESVAEVLRERGVLVAGELSAAIGRWKENLRRSGR